MPGCLLRWHPAHLLLDALEDLDGVFVCLEDNVELESFVLCAIDEFFKLGLARGHELRVLGPAGEAHPRVVEHAAAQVAPTRAHRLRVVLGQGAVTLPKTLAGRVVCKHNQALG